MKTVVVFQGGGALGAFAAGAWPVVADSLRARGDRVVAVAGTSIGALNAAVVAAGLDGPDLGARALGALWRDAIAQPSLTFCAPAIGTSDLARRMRSWNGLLTGLLVGNRALYRPRPFDWTPWNAANRVARPLYDRMPMQRTIDAVLGRYPRADSDRALLAAGATDIADGSLRLLHSDERAIGATELLASAAIPLMFAPVEIDGRFYWDGDLVRDSMMPPLWRQLRASGRLRDREPVQLVTIEQFAQRAATLPRSSLDLTFHLSALFQARKLDAPDGAADAAALRRVRIARAPATYDSISREFDYSPSRVEELAAQGEEAARAALAQADAATPRLGHPPRARRPARHEAPARAGVSSAPRSTR